jgi:hypothetical protein
MPGGAWNGSWNGAAGISALPVPSVRFLGVRADPDFGSSLRLVTAGGHSRAEPAELTMFIGWTWGAAVAMRIVDHVASLAAGRAG